MNVVVKWAHNSSRVAHQTEKAPLCSAFSVFGEPSLEYVEHRSEAYKSLYFYD